MEIVISFGPVNLESLSSMANLSEAVSAEAAAAAPSTSSSAASRHTRIRRFIALFRRRKTAILLPRPARFRGPGAGMKPESAWIQEINPILLVKGVFCQVGSRTSCKSSCADPLCCGKIRGSKEKAAEAAMKRRMFVYKVSRRHSM